MPDCPPFCERVDESAVTTHKDKDVPRQGIIAQVLADQLGQRVKALAQVGRCQGQPDAHGWGKAQHGRPSNTASNCRNVVASNPGATRTVRPSVRTTSRAQVWVGTASATTCTGTNVAGSSAARRSS